MQAEIVQILIESALAYLFAIVFIFIGQLFLKRTGIYLSGIDNNYGYAFYSLLLGLLITVCIYSSVVTKGITINILMVPLFLVLAIKRKKRSERLNEKIPHIEILLIIFVSVAILHFLPESEYKQNDSFYYLKISESLNKTGQENTYHYYNVYSDLFHGTEPYHYFELWCTALTTRITDVFYSNILTHRFIVYSIFITAIILGLYNLVGMVIKSSIRWWHKLFCWSLVFFMPDLIIYFPELSKFFVSNLEGNFLERPNFRILYALLIPVIAENISRKSRVSIVCFWLLILGLVSFKFALLIIPAMLLVGMYQLIKKERSGAQYIWYAIGFAGCFGLFYLITGIQKQSSFYSISISDIINEVLVHWKFVLFSIIASVGYLCIAALIFLLIFFRIKKNGIEIFSLLRSNFLLVLIALIGTTVARILFVKDNAYQFLFAAHIIAFLLIWLIAVVVIKKSRVAVWLFASFFFSVPVIVKAIVFKNPPDVFSQNGNYVYEGKRYSDIYLDSVASYFKKNKKINGAYLADSGFYMQTYYSRRNPTVYFPPITYIVSKKINYNIDLCISDSASIMAGIENPVHVDYLRSAIQRSLFYQYRKLHPALSLQDIQRKFIADHKLSYLIITAGVSADFIKESIETIYKDPVTAEQFIILKP